LSKQPSASIQPFHTNELGWANSSRSCSSLAQLLPRSLLLLLLHAAKP
jgi:hypothetical protein